MHSTCKKWARTIIGFWRNSKRRVCKIIGHKPIQNPKLWARKALRNPGGEQICARCGRLLDKSGRLHSVGGTRRGGGARS